MNGIKRFEYDPLNRLTNISDEDNNISYTYDGNGLRQSKTVNGILTSHIYDGMNVVVDNKEGEKQVYVRGLSLISRSVNNGENEYYIFNSHGDTNSLVNSNGDILKDYTYDAFGNHESVEDNNPFRYNGEYYDNETGYIYLRARYYDANIGRFITEDPIKDGINWYIYCHGDPVNFCDPFGLDENRLLTDLISEVGGRVKWTTSTKTATVTVNGITQEYVVGDDGKVYLNGTKVGYLNSNNKIVLWDNDFYRDYEIKPIIDYEVNIGVGFGGGIKVCGLGMEFEANSHYDLTTIPDENSVQTTEGQVKVSLFDFFEMGAGYQSNIDASTKEYLGNDYFLGIKTTKKVVGYYSTDESGDVILEAFSIGGYFIVGGEYKIKINLSELERRKNN